GDEIPLGDEDECTWLDEHAGGDPDAWTPFSPRWQRRPTDVPSTALPAHPGRRPLVSRHPHPSVARVVEPAAVVIWRPTPRLIANPGPPRVGEYPVSIDIRAPPVVDVPRAPHRSVVAVLEPFSVRSEVGAKGHGHIPADPCARVGDGECG